MLWNLPGQGEYHSGRETFDRYLQEELAFLVAYGVNAVSGAADLTPLVQTPGYMKDPWHFNGSWGNQFMANEIIWNASVFSHQLRMAHQLKLLRLHLEFMKSPEGLAIKEERLRTNAGGDA